MARCPGPVVDFPQVVALVIHRKPEKLQGGLEKVLETQ